VPKDLYNHLNTLHYSVRQIPRKHHGTSLQSRYCNWLSAAMVKEEASYHKEIAQQEERIKKLESSEGDENKEYTLRQEVSQPSSCFELRS
jgi:flagellar motility protein MotE (MotC chaperone)